MIKVEYDLNEIKRAQKILSGIPNGFSKAAEYASREAMSKLRTMITREIGAYYWLKPGYIKKSMYMRIGFRNAELLIRGTRSTLGSFNLTPKKAPAKRKAPGYISGGVRRDHGLTRFSKGFMLEHNNLAVLREGPGRHGSFQGLHILVGPAVAQIAGAIMEEQPEIKEAVKEKYLQSLKKFTRLISTGVLNPGMGGFMNEPKAFQV